MAGYLRRATREDVDLLYEWANDPLVRFNSFSTDQITYEEHKEWYNRILSGTDCRQYIYMLEEEAIGQIRLTINEDEVEIGYSICASKRGRGYGKQLLELAMQQIREELPEVRRLTAKVKAGNIASSKTFEQTGFLKTYEAFEISL